MKIYLRRLLCGQRVKQTKENDSLDGLPSSIIHHREEEDFL